TLNSIPETPTAECITAFTKRLCSAFPKKRILTELFTREALEESNVQFAHLLRHVGGEGWDVGLRLARLPGLHQPLMVPGLAIVLPHELLAQFDLLPFLVCIDIPEPVLVRRAEGVDEHQASRVIHRELLLAVHMDQTAFLNFLV